MAIDLFCLKERCQEEIVLLKKGMLEFSSFFLGQIKIIESFLGQEMLEKKVIGLRSLALSKMFLSAAIIQSLEKMWFDIVVIPVPDRNILTFQLATSSDSVAGDLCKFM